MIAPLPHGKHIIVFLGFSKPKICRARHVVSVYNPSTQGHSGKSLLPITKIEREEREEERREVGVGSERNVKDEEM